MWRRRGLAGAVSGMSDVYQAENFASKFEKTRVNTNLEALVAPQQCLCILNHRLGSEKSTTSQETSMQKVLHINPDKCTGCLQCEMACSFENYGTYATSKSRIKVFDFHHTGKKVPYTCTQCDEAWCLHACPVEAITVDKATGAKVVNESTCVGCKVCTIACPFGTVNYVQETGKVQKCDLCGGDPACAEACPTGAITFVDANWTGIDKMKQWADKLGNQPSAA
jgi:Fe-S-cluster-containing hydrogenase component 2